MNNPTTPQGEPISLPDMPNDAYYKLPIRVADDLLEWGKACYEAGRAHRAASPDVAKMVEEAKNRVLNAIDEFLINTREHDDLNEAIDALGAAATQARAEIPPRYSREYVADMEDTLRQIAKALGCNPQADAIIAAAQARAAVPAMAREPLTNEQIFAGWSASPIADYKQDSFHDGVRFAERHHGITADSARAAVGAEPGRPTDDEVLAMFGNAIGHEPASNWRTLKTWGQFFKYTEIIKAMRAAISAQTSAVGAEQSQRAAFHRHLQSLGIPSEMFQHDDEGVYEFPTVQHDWEVWQAALSAQTPGEGWNAPTPPVDAVPGEPDEAQQRKLFETRARKSGYSLLRDGDEYRHPPTQHAWQGWMMGAEVATPPAPAKGENPADLELSTATLAEQFMHGATATDEPREPDFNEIWKQALMSSPGGPLPDFAVTYGRMLLAATSSTVKAAPEATDDTKRLDWLETQKTAYGFADVQEGNEWGCSGAYATIRQCIDAARPPADGATKEGASHE